MFTKRNALAIAISGLLAATVSLSVSAKTTLKLSHNNDKTHPVHISMQSMADEVKKLTNGEVVIRIYPNTAN